MQIGFLSGSTSLFLTIIGPLVIASKNRKTYEITMGGTIIAVCFTLQYVFGTIVASIFIEFDGLS